MKSFSLVDAEELQMLLDKVNELEKLNDTLMKERDEQFGSVPPKTLTWSEYVPTETSLFFTH